MAAATGMCGVALGSDGGGSIRYPSALTGLFGIKPQRDRIPLGPDHHDAWNGLTAYGPLARTVRDAAVFLDATADDRRRRVRRRDRRAVRAASDRGLVRSRRSGRSRGSPTSGGPHSSDTAALLRTLGHDVFEQEVDYGPNVMWNVSVRYITGLQHDVARHGTARTAGAQHARLAAIGAPDARRWLTWARANEAAIASRMNPASIAPTS